MRTSLIWSLSFEASAPSAPTNASRVVIPTQGPTHASIVHLPPPPILYFLDLSGPFQHAYELGGKSYFAGMVVGIPFGHRSHHTFATIRVGKPSASHQPLAPRLDIAGVVFSDYPASCLHFCCEMRRPYHTFLIRDYLGDEGV